MSTNLIKFFESTFQFKLNDNYGRKEYSLESFLTRWTDSEIMGDYYIFPLLFPSFQKSKQFIPASLLKTQEEAKLLATDQQLLENRKKVFQRVLKYFHLLYLDDQLFSNPESESRIPGSNIIQLSPGWITQPVELYRWVIILNHFVLMAELGDEFSKKVNLTILKFFCNWNNFQKSYGYKPIPSNIFIQMLGTQPFLKSLLPYIDSNTMKFIQPVFTLKKISQLDLTRMDLNQKVKIKNLANYDPLLEDLYIGYLGFEIVGIVTIRKENKEEQKDNKGNEWNFFTALTNSQQASQLKQKIKTYLQEDFGVKMKEEWKGCKYWVATHSFGTDTAEDLRAREFKNKELYLEAYIRGVKVDTSPSRLKEICEKVVAQLPPVEWEKEMLLWYTSLTQEEKDLVDRYTNYSYHSMNMDLRWWPKRQAPLNDIINKGIPLPQEIVVYRYNDPPREKSDTAFLLADVGTKFEYLGYLSTSFLASYSTSVICKESGSYQPVLMRIRIPQGAKCVYIPSHEYELIFPHLSKLELTGKSIEKVVCSLDNNFQPNSWKEITIYDLVMSL